jgi:hypothetical protein
MCRADEDTFRRIKKSVVDLIQRDCNPHSLLLLMQAEDFLKVQFFCVMNVSLATSKRSVGYCQVPS